MPFSASRPANRPCCRSARSHRLPGGRCRPDHFGWRTSLRCRSRNPVCRFPGLRCSSAPRRFPDYGAAPTRRSVARPPLPEFGTSVCRSPGPVGPSTPFTLTRFPVPSSVTPPDFLGRSSWGAPTSSFRCAAPSVATGSPATRCFAAMWLLAPSGADSTSWIGLVLRLRRPEGLRRQTRSLDPGRQALSGTAPTIADTKPQVKSNN